MKKQPSIKKEWRMFMQWLHDTSHENIFAVFYSIGIATLLTAALSILPAGGFLVLLSPSNAPLIWGLVTLLSIPQFMFFYTAIILNYIKWCGEK